MWEVSNTVRDGAEYSETWAGGEVVPLLMRPILNFFSSFPKISFVKFVGASNSLCNLNPLHQPLPSADSFSHLQSFQIYNSDKPNV